MKVFSKFSKRGKDRNATNGSGRSFPGGEDENREQNRKHNKGLADAAKKLRIGFEFRSLPRGTKLICF